MNRLLTGELQTYNRLANGPICNYLNRTTAGVVSGAPAVVYGYIVTTVIGASAINVYDNGTAGSGTVLFVIPATTAVGVYQFPVGIIAITGVYADFLSTGTVNFLYAPGA